MLGDTLKYIGAAFRFKASNPKNAPLEVFANDFRSKPEKYVLEVTFEDDILTAKLRRKSKQHNDVC